MLRKEELLRKLLKELWLDASTKDLELICVRGDTGSKQSLWCHRPILALASPFLKNLIQESKIIS